MYCQNQQEEAACAGDEQIVEHSEHDTIDEEPVDDYDIDWYW